jgi:hypothetical protein
MSLLRAGGIRLFLALCLVDQCLTRRLQLPIQHQLQISMDLRF